MTFTGLILVFVCLAASTATDAPLLLVVALDGMRPDSINQQLTPNIFKLASNNLWAKDGIVPQFPSFTLPNFYSIATGLHVESHGIVGNTFYDPALHALYDWFDFGQNSTVKKDSITPKWYSGPGLPFWTLNELKGRHSGCLFWPMCDAEIAGRTPEFAVHYDEARAVGIVSVMNRSLDKVLGWFADEKAPINLGTIFYWLILFISVSVFLYFVFCWWSS